MVKIIYRVLIKKGYVSEFKKLANDILIPKAQSIPGCQIFSLFQNTSNPDEFIFYEVWRQHSDVKTYKEKLVATLGAARDGEEFPAKMNNLIEKDEDL